MGQIINPVDKGDFLFVSLYGNIFAVHDQDSREAEGIAEGLGQNRIVRQSGNVFFDLQKDLFAGEAMFVSELSERNAVNMGNPEDRILASMVNGE